MDLLLNEYVRPAELTTLSSSPITFPRTSLPYNSFNFYTIRTKRVPMDSSRRGLSSDTESEDFRTVDLTEDQRTQTLIMT